MRYRLHSPDVIQETVDGEALVIHTPSGTYYSLLGTGEQVWNALLVGHTPAEIATVYASAGENTFSALLEAVEDFAHQLQDEQLLIRGDETAASGDLPPVTAPFTTPRIEKFTDMQELLLVDPIHEVDPQMGWPQRRDAK